MVLPRSRPWYLGWVFTAICIGVCGIIALMLVLSIVRRRHGDQSVLRRDAGGVQFVYIATAISTVILLGMTIYMLVVLNNVATPPAKPAMTITVTGHQWWWEAVYNNDDLDKNFTTANEIHIPVGVPVAINLKSADVIHSFWVPELAGKTQMIPGMINRQWIEADRPGIYRGQCTQYCGVQHAHMAFEVIADSTDDFARWRTAQLQPALPIRQGAEIFRQNCAGCHTVRATAAGDNGAASHAPDLTHLMSRRTIAAGLLENNPDNLANWIQNVQQLKPGAQMPDYHFSAKDQADLIAYLSSLH